ncbi:hypothetical protein TrLO_g14490 [Triparma laevis f. longispina]|uniref:Creatine kinase n=1 Tax=Triparma laevis f. longispina TaxID=1714387 RepID=A0A9W7E4T5_9STRA|nr:hypothetical protein TrLO_g14490 [Triparma laevis f. longispina]
MHSFRRAPVLVPVLGLAGLLAAYHNQHSKAPATEISSKSSPNFSTFPPLSGLTFPSPHLSTASCEGWGSRKSTKRIFKYSADDDYPYFSKYHQSLMRKHLTNEVYTKLLPLRTSNGYTINDVIACGTTCGYSLPRSMGCMAGDYESYSLFAPFFSPIIKEYHDFSPKSRHTTDLNPGHLKSVKDLDPNSEYVLSTRIRVARSIRGLPFPAASSRAARRKVESLARTCTETLKGDLEGMYMPLNDMDNDVNDDLIQRHICFDNPDEWSITARLGQDWPDARGVYINCQDLDETPDFVVWVNEEDHLRIMCLRKGGDIFAVFEKLVRGVNAMERQMKEQGFQFLHDDHLGYVVGCPTNLGTGMRASMHVKLIKLAKLPGFIQMCNRMGLDVRGKHGEKDTRQSGIFDISNRHRLGFSEVELIQLMIDGVGFLIKLEKRLEAGEEVDLEKEYNKV